jgi:signal transduction histidine kinase/ActR/RegA family two-component response regulator
MKLRVTQALSRKQLEEELARLRAELDLAREQPGVANYRRALRDAQRASDAKTRFLAIMSHELRTPLTAILACADLLIDEARAAAADPRSLELLLTLRRNGQHLVRILSDILDFAKLEAGRLEVEHIDTRPPEILRDVEQLMAPAAQAKGIGFQLEVAEDLPALIRSDPTRLRQILVNLVGNAVKFTETGGVRVTARRVQPEGGPAALEVRVADTGCGMAPSTVERIFQPFSQADETMARRFGGTGLGLAISNELARLLGATLSCESSEGQGSSFCLTLPIRHALVPAAEAPASGEGEIDESTRTLISRIGQAAGPARILLVEDSADNRRLLQLILARAGFQVSFAHDGQEGLSEALLAHAGGEPFDVILMDMQMPVLDGYTATRRLRQIGYTGPIVALTAHSLAGERERCLAAGCDAYATKPIERNALLRLILGMLKRGA